MRRSLKSYLMRELSHRLFHTYGAAIVGVVLIAGLLMLVCHVRLRRLRRRERLAREVEDALLQNAQGLILNVHGIAKELPADDPTRQRMENALDRADDQLSTDRDRVQDLRTHRHRSTLRSKVSHWLNRRRPE